MSSASQRDSATLEHDVLDTQGHHSERALATMEVQSESTIEHTDTTTNSSGSTPTTDVGDAVSAKVIENTLLNHSPVTKKIRARGLSLEDILSDPDSTLGSKEASPTRLSEKEGPEHIKHPTEQKDANFVQYQPAEQTSGATRALKTPRIPWSKFTDEEKAQRALNAAHRVTAKKSAANTAIAATVSTVKTNKRKLPNTYEDQGDDDDSSLTQEVSSHPRAFISCIALRKRKLTVFPHMQAKRIKLLELNADVDRSPARRGISDDSKKRAELQEYNRKGELFTRSYRYTSAVDWNDPKSINALNKARSQWFRRALGPKRVPFVAFAREEENYLIEASRREIDDQTPIDWITFPNEYNSQFAGRILPSAPGTVRPPRTQASLQSYRNRIPEVKKLKVDGYVRQGKKATAAATANSTTDGSVSE
ncbi:MAG: hypothetical protein M4579_005113 [Chaenotheca gracillima]|nr:MAG: hypothetical protein M4579_005113 [Chaenotheca gracillima]